MFASVFILFLILLIVFFIISFLFLCLCNFLFLLLFYVCLCFNWCLYLCLCLCLSFFLSLRPQSPVPRLPFSFTHLLSLSRVCFQNIVWFRYNCNPTFIACIALRHFLSDLFTALVHCCINLTISASFTHFSPNRFKHGRYSSCLGMLSKDSILSLRCDVK